VQLNIKQFGSVNSGEDAASPLRMNISVYYDVCEPLMLQGVLKNEIAEGDNFCTKESMIKDKMGISVLKNEFNPYRTEEPAVGMLSCH